MDKWLSIMKAKTLKEVIMKTSQLLLVCTFALIIACNGCSIEPEGQTILREAYEVTVEPEGQTRFEADRDIIQHNAMTAAFMVSMCEGLRTGDYWDSGDNQFELVLYHPPLLQKSVFWSSAVRFVIHERHLCREEEKVALAPFPGNLPKTRTNLAKA